MPTARSSSRSTRRKLVSHWWTRRPARSVTSASTRTLTCTWWEAVKDVRDQVRHRLRPHEHLRVVLDTEYVPHKGDGGEARAAMRCFHRLARLVPGAHGVNYDMAMRGTHIDEAMRELGRLIITKVHETKGSTREPPGVAHRGPGGRRPQRPGPHAKRLRA